MKQNIKGVLFGLAAFGAWGFFPVYWKQLQSVNAFEILCHRIVWSSIFLGGIIAWQQRWNEVLEIIQNPRAVNILVISGFLVGFNWFVYIWAVNSGRVVETSLGYYMNPMINVGLGYLLLQERFSKIQWSAVFFALSGVIYALAAYGTVPVFALALAFSFAFYGLSRKKIDALPIPMLFIETLILFIPALAYIGFRVAMGTTPFLEQAALSVLCIGAGVVTSLPLLWFAAAVKRLKLSTIGILQYLAPSIAFVLGVFVYKEPFSRHNLITFVFIWAGVILYIWDTTLHKKS
ncbi:EamA family transporter RarD [uncultured Desulfobacter sp.]|uniref:EamA family transporter RarD n=1 Tax=uncultured Desulfobacter sp. TaxID=240139 RepID=UPI002AAB3392|nr:EamA family transporter RarD [uncultured Desulfobacter sp.]